MNTCSACGISKLPVEHSSSVFLEENKWCRLWVQTRVRDAGRSKGLCGENCAKRVSLHMHVLYEDLTDDPN